MSITYQEVLFSETYIDIYPMLQDHWDELGQAGGFKDFNLDFAKYQYMEERGLLVCAVAMKDGAIIGYMCYVLDPMGHNSKYMRAISDAMYVVPKYRETIAGVGNRLLKFAEKRLHDVYGAKAISIGVNVNYDLSGFLEKSGYTKSEVVYLKTLGD